MSYILEALRRAEADRERERGQVPGLHTPPAPGSSAAPSAGSRRWLLSVGGGLLLLAGVGAGSWWAGAPHDTPPRAAPSAPPGTPAVLVAAAPASAVAAASAAVLPAPLPAATVLLPPMPPSAARPGRAVGVAAVPVPTPVVEARIPPLSELPDNIRNALPRLTLGGSVYSEDPANRMVIINGEVMHEGARLGAELVLEQIRPRELVLRFRSQRYRQPV